MPELLALEIHCDPEDDTTSVGATLLQGEFRGRSAAWCMTDSVRTFATCLRDLSATLQGEVVLSEFPKGNGRIALRFAVKDALGHITLVARLADDLGQEVIAHLQTDPHSLDAFASSILTAIQRKQGRAVLHGEA